MSCNIINQKINQLRNFSKEIESHSYDNIKNNLSVSDNKSENLNHNFNFFSYMNNQNNSFQRNKMDNPYMNLTTKKFFLNPKLFLNDENSFNNEDKIYITNKKKYSLKNFNHINNFNEIPKINSIDISNYIARKKNMNSLLRQNETDINLINNSKTLNETKMKLISSLKDEKMENNVNKKINVNKNKNAQYLLYNKILNKNNNIFHKRFNSHGINNFSIASNQSQNVDIEQYKKNINDDNLQKSSYFQKKNENKNRNRVGLFDKIFKKNKSEYSIENSCSYNIINQKLIEKPNINNINNKFQIQESSKITYYISNNKISNNNFKNKNNKNGNTIDNKNKNENKEINHNKLLFPIYSNNFSIKSEKKEEENVKINLEGNKYNKNNNIFNVINKEEIKERQNLNIEEEKNNEIKIIKEMNNNKNNNDLNISISDRDDLIINSEKESISSNIINKKNTEGKIISSDSDPEKKQNYKNNFIEMKKTNNYTNINLFQNKEKEYGIENKKEKENKNENEYEKENNNDNKKEKRNKNEYEKEKENDNEIKKGKENKNENKYEKEKENEIKKEKENKKENEYEKEKYIENKK